MEPCTCSKCKEELNEAAIYYDFPLGTKNKLCQKCYDEYLIACAEKGAATENAEWAG